MSWRDRFPLSKLPTFRLALLIGGLAVGGCAPTRTPQIPTTTTPITIVPMSEFANRPPRRLVAVHAKLTYLFEQTKPVSTVVCGSFRRLVDLHAFQALRKPGVSYINDELPRVENFSVTTDELQKMLQAANGIPAVRESRRDGQHVSFMVLGDEAGRRKGCEAILNKLEAQALVRALRNEVSPSNGMAINILDSFLTRAF